MIQAKCRGYLVRKQIEHGNKVRIIEIKEKAKQILKTMNLDGEFTASNSWYSKFSRRFKIKNTAYEQKNEENPIVIKQE